MPRAARRKPVGNAVGNTAAHERQRFAPSTDTASASGAITSGGQTAIGGQTTAARDDAPHGVGDELFREPCRHQPAADTALTTAGSGGRDGIAITREIVRGCGER